MEGAEVQGWFEQCERIRDVLGAAMNVAVEVCGAGVAEGKAVPAAEPGCAADRLSLELEESLRLAVRVRDYLAEISRRF